MHSKKNTQLGYLRSLLIPLIGLLSLLGVTQCDCNKTSEPSGKFALKIAANKTLLRAPESEFEVIVKPVEGSSLSLLTDVKLKAQFLEKETFGKKDAQDSHLAHKHAADKQVFTTNCMIPLTEYTTETASASASEEEQEEQNELRIPIILHPANQATKLKVGIELVDAQDNTLQNLEVIWVKNELLISDLTIIETQKEVANLTLKNTKDIPLKTSNITLNLKSEHGEALQFSKTSTSQVTLEELWDNHTTLDPGAETSPISLKLNKTTEGQTLSNLTITISQEGDKILATKTMLWPQMQITASPSTQPQAQQEETGHPTTLPNLQVKVGNITNKKFKLFVENTGKKISKKRLHDVKLKYSVQGTGDITNVRLKRGNLSDINGAALVELIRSGLQERQTKELEIILEPDNADHLMVQLFLEGTQSCNLATFNWNKKEKSTKKEETPEKGKEKTQQATDNSKEKLEEPKEKSPSSLPTLHIIKNEKPTQQAASTLQERPEQATSKEKGQVQETANNLKETLVEASKEDQEEIRQVTNSLKEGSEQAPIKEKEQTQEHTGNLKEDPQAAIKEIQEARAKLQEELFKNIQAAANDYESTKKLLETQQYNYENPRKKKWYQNLSGFF